MPHLQDAEQYFMETIFSQKKTRVVSLKCFYEQQNLMLIK